MSQLASSESVLADAARPVFTFVNKSHIDVKLPRGSFSRTMLITRAISCTIACGDCSTVAIAFSNWPCSSTRVRDSDGVQQLVFKMPDQLFEKQPLRQRVCRAICRYTARTAHGPPTDRPECN
ncbi:hypothetical protein CEXT_330011 [Caerostris extrusa]|uniref:Uncharacterized protein n=1 Tax=Caerostris extrusa TaxID=172846 RepID=A0AAV4XH64_CAEEX|nr:hypothetical protein CEXT_330011 [Caerostris extrusa]